MGGSSLIFHFRRMRFFLLDRSRRVELKKVLLVCRGVSLKKLGGKTPPKSAIFDLKASQQICLRSYMATNFFVDSSGIGTTTVSRNICTNSQFLSARSEFRGGVGEKCKNLTLRSICAETVRRSEIMSMTKKMRQCPPCATVKTVTFYLKR